MGRTAQVGGIAVQIISTPEGLALQGRGFSKIQEKHMRYDHTLTTQATLKHGTTKEQVANALEPIFDYFGYTTLDDDLLEDHQIEFNPETGELNAYFNGEVSYGYDDLVIEVAKKLGPLTKAPGYFMLSDYDTADLDNARNKIYFGASDDEIEAFKAQEDITAAMSLLAGHIDGELVTKIREIATQALGKREGGIDVPKQIEIFQGHFGLEGTTLNVDFHSFVGASVAEKDAAFMAALAQQADVDYHSVGVAGCAQKANVSLLGVSQAIASVMMQDIVGNYDTPDQVPEWSWVERVASYAHAKNGQDGIWEFVLNLSNGWDDIPESLLPIISKARADNIAYLIVHQGT
jgi:hypothetical protein